MKRDKTYQVVSRSAVTVEFPNGNVVSYRSGDSFQAHSTNPCITRLIRINSIREVSSRELPTFRMVDTVSSSIPSSVTKRARRSSAGGEE